MTKLKIEPLVSIIVRTYNRENLLEQALESLSEQTYSQLEIIVVNDGGRDVRQIVKPYEQKCLRCIYCPLEENQGRSAAANYGLQHVTGEYVLFLDDDDYVLAEHLSILVQHLSESPKYKAAYTDTQVQSPDGDFIMSDPYDISILRYGNFLPIHSVMFCSELLESVSFDSSLTVYEDWDFWLQIAEYTDFLHVKNHATAVYRALGNSDVGVICNVNKQKSEKLKVIKKWLASWTAEDILDVFYAIEDKKNRDLNEHQAVIQENASRMKTQGIEIESLKSDNKNLFEANDKLNNANNILHRDNIDINKINNNLSKANDALYSELQLVYHSLSWKITEPLRFIRGLFK